MPFICIETGVIGVGVVSYLNEGLWQDCGNAAPIYMGDYCNWCLLVGLCHNWCNHYPLLVSAVIGVDTPAAPLSWLYKQAV